MHKQSSLTLSDDAHAQAIASLRAYAGKNMEHELNELQATLLLDHILADIGPVIYNQAALYARAYIEERAADLEAALNKSEFPVSGRRTTFN